jgi:DNA-binding IclR family transcriptional regulator
MAALAAASGETIGLLVAVKDQAVCLDMVESQHPLRCSFTKGRGLPLARGASAKSLLAFMPLARLQAALAYLAAEAEVDAARLGKELDAIREQGYAVTDSEVDAGVWGVSVPIFQRANQAVASITLMAPSTRAAQRPDALIEMTVAAARRITSKLQVH